jgi:hypothetical protein
VIPENRQLYHFGVNFVFAPVPDLGATQRLRFQQNLAAEPHMIAFDAMATSGEMKLLQRASPPLQVALGAANQQLAQLAITAMRPTQSLQEFISEAEAVATVYHETWPGPVQVVQRDCTIRHLCPVREAHAFKFLWETRLRQEEGDISLLGRPVLGGGVRFVMPARQGVADDPLIEVKVESLFEDTTQLFIEAAFVWRQPKADARIAPAELLQAVDEYLKSEVTNFIMLEKAE